MRRVSVRPSLCVGVSACVRGMTVEVRCPHCVALHDSVAPVAVVVAGRLIPNVRSGLGVRWVCACV